MLDKMYVAIAIVLLIIAIIMLYPGPERFEDGSVLRTYRIISTGEVYDREQPSSNVVKVVSGLKSKLWTYPVSGAGEPILGYSAPGS